MDERTLPISLSPCFAKASWSIIRPLLAEMYVQVKKTRVRLLGEMHLLENLRYLNLTSMISNHFGSVIFITKHRFIHSSILKEVGSHITCQSLQCCTFCREGCGPFGPYRNAKNCSFLNYCSPQGLQNC